MSKQFTSGQQRLPLVNIQNKAKIANENVKQSKNTKGQCKQSLKLDINNDEDLNIKKDYIITDNIDSIQNNKNMLSEDDDKHGDIEFTKSVQIALKNAIEENDTVK